MYLSQISHISISFQDSTPRTHNLNPPWLQSFQDPQKSRQRFMKHFWRQLPPRPSHIYISCKTPNVLYRLWPQCEWGIWRDISDERGGDVGGEVHLHPAGHLHVHVQDRHHLVPLRRPELRDEVRQLDVQWVQGRQLMLTKWWRIGTKGMNSTKIDRTAESRYNWNCQMLFF